MNPDMTATKEHTAIQTDAEQRITELRAVARELWPDRDDAHVMSELLSVISRLRQAESELKQSNALMSPGTPRKEATSVLTGQSNDFSPNDEGRHFGRQKASPGGLLGESNDSRPLTVALPPSEPEGRK